MTPESGPDIGAAAIEAAIRSPKAGGPALVAYLTAGFPTRDAFAGLVQEVAGVADVVEIGIPFSDPMADGATIQDASRVALEQGASLGWALDALADAFPSGPPAPLVLMSYLNPLLRFGMERLAERSVAACVSGVIVPDLPYDETDEVAGPLRERGMGVVQMATVVSSAERLRLVGEATSGFLYAVTSLGTTGSGSLDTSGVTRFLDDLRAITQAPVCAGFGIRTPDHVRSLAGHCDGVIVGSALVETIGSGGSAGAFLRSLRIG
ncbi:MAG: tryptophan synthase subunit alpha [Phycisphaerae bacterium]|nr:tryptophan synthase subunit alpha [Phycisphaerae bacterium]